MKQNLITLTAVLTLAVGLFGITGATAQSETDDPAQVAAGMVVFESNCAGCHGADGTGSNSGRPLIGIAEQQPDRTVHIASVTDGKGNMPAWGDSLSVEEIDSAVSYVRLTFVAQDAEPELAVTGVETTGMIAVGATMLAAGAVLVRRSRRDDELT